MTPAHADDYDDMRVRWSTRLTGGAAVVTAADADVAAQVAALASAADANWRSMDASAGRGALWSDLSNWTASATITKNYARLYGLALAYATAGSSLYHNARLAADIVAALDWLHASHYNAAVASTYDNWWDWQIGTPQALNNIMVLMFDQLSAAHIASYNAAIDHFSPDSAWRTRPDGRLSTTAETGANRLDKALVAVIRGIVGKSGARLAQGRDAIGATLPYVRSGDGFYADGSFVQHGYVAYTGSYGAVAMADYAQLFYILNGSSWRVMDAGAGNVATWAMQSFAPFIYDGAMVDAVRGRAIARQGSSDHAAGRGVIASLALLSEGLAAHGADTHDQAAGGQRASGNSASGNAASGQGAGGHDALRAANLKALLKGWMQRDTSFGASYFSSGSAAAGAGASAASSAGIGLHELGLLKSLLRDDSIAAAAEPVSARVYASMDRAVARTPGAMFVVSLFSPRISAFEYGNGENVKGWWTGMGMTSMYNADLAQFDGGYWPTIDMARLPGTTTDHSGSGTPAAWKLYANTRNNVGGATLDGQYAVVGMDYATRNVTGSSLAGKKAWFLFGDRIVAVGSGITSTDGVAVETIAENRKLNGAGDNGLTVDGHARPASAGWSESMAGVHWAHLAGTVRCADIGYYFPDAPTVSGLRERRSGAWRDINSVNGSAATVTNTYLSLALPHGANPRDGAYSYVLLPNRTAAQTAAYAAAPSVSVLARSASVSAVRDMALGLTGVMFWDDASTTVSIAGQPYASSDSKAALITRINGDAGDVLDVGVAEPTQANARAIHIEIHRRAVSVLAADSGVTVTQLSPTITFSVSAAAAAGKTFHVRFQLK